MDICSGTRLVRLLVRTFCVSEDDWVLSGNESIAVVEFAPFQKVPNEKKKVDSRAGTIEKGV